MVSDVIVEGLVSEGSHLIFYSFVKNCRQKPPCCNYGPGHEARRGNPAVILVEISDIIVMGSVTS